MVLTATGDLAYRRSNDGVIVCPLSALRILQKETRRAEREADYGSDCSSVDFLACRAAVCDGG